MATERRAFT